MLLHRVPPSTEERTRPQGVDHVHELPELPAGVVVPDDLSGLGPPTGRTGVHWLRWVAVLAVVVIAAAVVLLVRGGGDTEPTVVMSPAAEIVQSEIDTAIAEQRVAQQVRSHYVDVYADYLAVQPLPAYQIIQNAIDAAILEQAIPVVMSPAAEIIQAEIDHAINEQAVLNQILGYYEDLATRTG